MVDRFSTHMQTLTGQLELSKSHYARESVFHTKQGIMLEMKWVKTMGLRTSQRDEMWVETDERPNPPPCRQVRDMVGFAITNIPNSNTILRTYGTRGICSSFGFYPCFVPNGTSPIIKTHGP